MNTADVQWSEVIHRHVSKDARGLSRGDDGGKWDRAQEKIKGSRAEVITHFVESEAREPSTSCSSGGWLMWQAPVRRPQEGGSRACTGASSAREVVEETRCPCCRGNCLL